MYRRGFIYGVFVFFDNHDYDIFYGGIVLNGYLLCVMGTVLICSILTAITPEGRTSSVIKGVARLSCVLAIIAPVLDFLKTGDIAVFSDKNGQEIFSQEGIESESAFIQYYSEMRISQTESALQVELEEKYGVTAEVTFCWSQSEEKIRIDKIRVKLSNKASEGIMKEVREYLTKNYCSEVLIE